MPLTMVVLPVPGPPVISSTPVLAAERMASRCWSEYRTALSDSTFAISRSRFSGSGWGHWAIFSRCRALPTSASWIWGR